jgi:hypothetical protein
MPPARCTLCGRLLMLDRASATTAGEPPIVVCDVCRALPRHEQKHLRNRAMTRMLRASLPRH